MMRKITSIALFVLFSVATFSQIPSGYYSTAEGKTGATLKTALFNIIKTHTVRTYSNLWTDFQTTDKRTDGKVWDMYSSCSLTFVIDQDNGSGGTSECEKYNREHSFPNSWFNGDQASPMYTDLFHLYPTDKKVNNTRSNYIYGVVLTPSYTSSNGCKLGSSDPATGFSGTVFEPINEYKGDFARSYFYMATCYEDKIAGWASYATEAQAILAGNSFPAYKAWYVTLLLGWCQQDPVSQKEIDRNNAVYSIQGNRNPYIDHPEYVQAVWGTNTGVDNVNSLSHVSIYPNPAKNEISVEALNTKADDLKIVNVTGNTIIQTTYDGGEKTIDISKLNPGVYIVIISGKTFRNATKIVIY
ncbi:MAG: endonuclease [Bacteroidales bacterium]|nr:endonuclease [Bacteroidales bacterium]